MSLHVVEELWQILQDPNTIPALPIDQDNDSGDDLMSISVHAMNGCEAARTIKIVGNIKGHQPILLLDSGSSSNFISEKLAAEFTEWTPLLKPVCLCK